MRIHRRQFILGPRPVRPFPDWLTIDIPGIGYLSHCPELRTASAESADGQTWYLLGLAVQTSGDKRPPIEEIESASSHSVQNLYHTWAGRWVLIGRGQLHMDASGLLGCFYYINQTAQETSVVWTSSSPALLADILDLDTTPTRRIERHSSTISWYPPPHSRFRSVRRLLPSQILELPYGGVLPRPLIAEIPGPMSYDNELDWLQQYFEITLREASKLSDRLWLALTAGYDSRLLLAAAECSRIPLRTYTQAYGNMSRSDRLVPPQLARTAVVSHALIQPGSFANEVAALHDRHTGGHTVDWDRTFISQGQWDWCQPGDLILRGGVVPVASYMYWRRFPQFAQSPVPPDAEVIVDGFRTRDMRDRKVLLNSIREWVDWASQTPHADLDWRDRFYLEQRLGGWLSSIEQSLDLIAAETFEAANSHVYFAHVLKIEREIRFKKSHQAELIRRMSPRLLHLRFNEPLHRKVFYKVRRELRWYLTPTRTI